MDVTECVFLSICVVSYAVYQGWVVYVKSTTPPRISIMRLPTELSSEEPLSAATGPSTL